MTNLVNKHEILTVTTMVRIVRPTETGTRTLTGTFIRNRDRNRNHKLSIECSVFRN